MRQNALTVATGWHRTRPSHHLTRMEDRGYVARRKVTNGVEVSMAHTERAAYPAAQPPFDAAVHAHFFDKLDPADRAALRTILDKLGGARGRAGRPSLVGVSAVRSTV